VLEVVKLRFWDGSTVVQTQNRVVPVRQV
jgi:hypothetical protein